MPRRRNQLPPDVDPRTHLMDAALRAFARHGYAGASVRAIAAEAGVASGLLYHYFPTKQALLLALFERSGGLVLQAFAEVAEVACPRARLAALLRVSTRIVRENADFYRVSYGVRAQPEVLAELGAGPRASMDLFVALFVELLGALGRPDPPAEARLLIASLDGAFQHFLLDADDYPIDAVVEALLTRTLGGPPP